MTRKRVGIPVTPHGMPMNICEMRAYQKEIDLANSLGRNDIADKLISLRDKEVSDIKKRDEMYAEIFKNDSND